MAYIFNPFTGQLDDINYNASMSGSGELQLGSVSLGARSFIEAKALRLYQIVSATPTPTGRLIARGQPIPIGMGLTFTYADDIGASSIPKTISQGQPIPIGMGLNITYGQDV